MPGGVPVPSAPRPKVTVGAVLLIVGSAVALIGAFLPWLTASGDTLNGFNTYLTSDLQELESPGIATLFGALIGLGLGIALLAAGRVLAVAIIAIVFAALGVLVGGVLWAIVADSLQGQFGSVGIGLILQPIGPLIALVGAIIATATRRPGASAEPYFPT